MLEFSAWYSYIFKEKFGVNSGTLYAFSSNSDIIEYLKRSSRSSTQGALPSNNVGKNCFSSRCFDPFWGNFYKTGLFYFCFPAMPTWYGKVIDEFNNTFKNLQIEIVDDLDVYHWTKNFMGDVGGYLTFDLTDSRAENVSKLKKPILLLKTKGLAYGDDSSTISRVNYAVHHFFRLLSYPEIYYITLLDEDPGKDYIKFVLNLNNRIIEWKPRINASYHDMVYRSLSEKIVPFDTFMLLDDVNATKNLSSYSVDSRVKQTSIFFYLFKDTLKQYVGSYFTFDPFNDVFKGLANGLLGIGKFNSISKGYVNITVYDYSGVEYQRNKSMENFFDAVKFIKITDEEARVLLKDRYDQSFSDTLYTRELGSWRKNVILNEYGLFKKSAFDSPARFVKVVDHLIYPNTIERVMGAYELDNLIEVTDRDWQDRIKYFKTIGVLD